MKRFLFGILSACLPLSAAAAEQVCAADARAIDRPTYQVGDHWIQWNGVKREITRISDNRIVLVREGKEYLYDLNMNLIQSYGARTVEPVEYRPPYQTVMYPLCPGKKWGGTGFNWFSGGYSGSYDFQAEAGQWSTYNIKTQDGRRLVFEGIPVRMTYTEKNETTTTTCWVVPELKGVGFCRSSNPAFNYTAIEHGQKRAAGGGSSATAQ
ncbi:MAG TPA: hypothetical protein VED01_05120 [Burkholderiales bacterium]|nr:hypothetical protein [Burkholderiales bacterium]